MSLIAELKRRNVFKVGAAYLALAWVVVQATGAIVPALNLPATLVPTVVWIGIIGFPCVLIFAWVYELTPEGLKRESEIDRSQSFTHVTSKRLDYIIIGMLAVAIGLFVLDRIFPSGAPSVGAGHARDTESSVGAGHARDQVEEIRRHDPLPQEQTSTAAPDEKSIAVLPFVNMSSDKEQEYFSDGISEELLNLLAKIEQLKVAARTSSFSYKGKDTRIAQIGQELNVAHVLEGSVRKAGNTVRITAQLVRAADGYHLWSETYDRPLDDIFAVQDEIAGAVVEQLRIKLLGAAPKSRVTDPQAYALFLRARQLSESGTAESLQLATTLFEQGLVIDPGYAEGWCKLAAIAEVQAGFGLLPWKESVRRQREYIDKALAIDPDFARAHDRLANLAASYDLDLPAAARHWMRALELDPRNTDILFNAGWLMAALGRMEQAIAMGEYANAGDPLSAIGHAGISGVYILAGRLDQAIASSRRALGLNPGYLGAQANIGVALLLKGEPQAALEATLQEPSERFRLGNLALVYEALGMRTESDAALAELIGKYEQSATWLIASVYAWRGDNDRAFAWLDKTFHERDSALVTLAWDPLFARLHDDPRWEPLLRTHGLAPEQLAAIEFDVKLPQQQ